MLPGPFKLCKHVIWRLYGKPAKITQLLPCLSQADTNAASSYRVFPEQLLVSNYHYFKIPPLDPVFCQFHPVHNLTTYFHNVYFKNTLASIPWFSTRSLFLIQKSAWKYCFLHVCPTSSSSKPHWFLYCYFGYIRFVRRQWFEKFHKQFQPI